MKVQVVGAFGRDFDVVAGSLGVLLGDGRGKRGRLPYDFTPDVAVAHGAGELAGAGARDGRVDRHAVGRGPRDDERFGRFVAAGQGLFELVIVREVVFAAADGAQRVIVGDR